MNLFTSIPEALNELRKNSMLIVVDSPDRENQADIIFPAEVVTEKKINFLIQACRGFICVPLTARKAYQLGLPLMVDKKHNTESTGVNFTVTVDTKEVKDFGISASDRSKTIQTIANPASKASDLVRPGHVFPLLAAEKGLLARQGHTEAAVTLCELAGFQPIAVLCEVLRGDGNVARITDLIAFAKTNHLKIISITDLIAYLKEHPQKTLSKSPSVIKEATSSLPTKYGIFQITIYKSLIDNLEHTVLSMGDIAKQPVLTRLHSQCLTGDTFFSLRCDCREQLHQSMRLISKNKAGLILYLNQEGRGIGLANKINAYALQDSGQDTVEANSTLGYPRDAREYDVAAEILQDLGISNILLLTNNPDKITQLTKKGITIVRRIPIEIKPNSINRKYLVIKKQKLGHLLSF